MRTRVALVVSTLVAASALLVVTHPAAAADVTVAVHDNYFAPGEVVVDPGTTMTWSVVDGGHTVRADDGSFEFPTGDTSAKAGEAFTHEFHTEGTFRFYCEIHGAPGGVGMAGVIYVGDRPPSPARQVPSAEFPTISAALASARAGTVIEVAPGRYAEALTVEQDNITIVGTGTTNADVVIEGSRDGVGVFADAAEGLILDNFTVSNAAGGVVVRDGDRLTVRNLDLGGISAVGLRVQRTRAVAISDVRVHGAAQGIWISDCDLCGAAVRRVIVEGADTGVRVSNAGHVDVVDSTLTSNRFGVLFETVAGTGDLVQRGGWISGNTLDDNDTGIAVRGARQVEVVGNVVRSGVTGISVEGVPVPSTSVRVIGNAVSAYRGVGLRWDLAGVDVCFGANTDPAAGGNGPATEPALLQTIASCSPPGRYPSGS